VVARATVTEVGKSPINAQAVAAGQAINFKVVVRLTEPVPGARPGLSCTADITTAVRDDVLAVPIQALLLREVSADEEGDDPSADAGDAVGDGSVATIAGETARDGAGDTAQPDDARDRDREGAFVIRDGRARFVPIEIGIAGERHFEVLSGVAEDDQVIIGPFDRLRDLQDDDPVEVEDAPGRGRRGNGNGDR
jgi:HlyD family secretion protein